MDAQEVSGTFQSLSQRAASTYRRMLAEYCPVQREGVSLESQADLHAFFRALYDALYAAPEQFGLPVSEDIGMVVDHAREGFTKTDLKRMLDRPRKLMDEGLAFLSAVGLFGDLAADGSLLLDPRSPALDFLKKKPGRAWVKGLGAAGLELTDKGGIFMVTSTQHPHMLPALKALAQACAACPEPFLGPLFFARCDLRALNQDFSVDALDLYRIFPPEDYAHAVKLHAYFTGRGYQPQVILNRLFAWEVKYQGKRSVKGSPLFQVEYDERFRHQMRARIKCASAQRVAPLVPAQSQALQDDFASRVMRCGDCHWCDSQKSLGPVVYTYQGELRKICWYVNPDIEELTDEMDALVQEYALMHEKLG